MQLRLLAVAVAVLALGGLSLTVAHDGPGFTFADTNFGSVALLAAGWSLAAAGLVFWFDRPRNRTGPLLVAAGGAWLASEWDNPGSGSAVLFTAGLMLFAAGPPLVGWVALAYPTGRMATAAERLAVAGGLVSGVAVLGLLPALFFDPAAVACSLCPDNLALVDSDPARARSLPRLGFRVSAVASVAVVVVAWWRLVRASVARRRLAAPVVGAVSVYLGSVAWLYLESAERGFIGTGDVERRLWLGQAAALVGLSLAVGWGRLAVRRTRSSLARLVVDLGETARAGGLRHALARSLDDESLDVAYPVGDGLLADASGRLVELPPSDGRGATPIIRDGEPVAVIVHRPGLLDDPDLVDEVTSAARLALDYERLQAALWVQEAALRASRARVVAAADDERRRLERDLHDGAQQRLIGLLIALRVAASGAARAGDDEVAALLADGAGELQGAVDAVRDIAHRIHPVVLSDAGLLAALEELAEGGTWPLSVTGMPDRRLPEAVESAVYRVVAEAAGLGEVSVTAVEHGGELVIDVDGPAVPESIVELEDRVGALGGRLMINVADGASVRMHIIVPVEEVPCG